MDRAAGFLRGSGQPFVRGVASRLDAPERRGKARIIGVEDLPIPVGRDVQW